MQATGDTHTAAADECSTVRQGPDKVAIYFGCF